MGSKESLRFPQSMQNKYVKLIIGTISSSEKASRRTVLALKRSFGPIDYTSKEIDFDYTSYYEDEMGPNLKRTFYSFSKLIAPEKLPLIKAKTIGLEKDVARRIKTARRPINIDPGYLNDAKLILASTKDYYHRIYLGKAIYGELTLSYRDRSFQPMEWTYPDYRTSAYITIFNEIRDIFMEQRQI